MSPGQGASGDARKGCRAGGGGGAGRPATAAGAWAVSALCLLLSAGSAVACLLLGVQAAALQGRVAALEEERELLWRAGSPDTLVAWAEPQLERLLREVSRRARGWECPCAGSRRGEERSPASCERPSSLRGVGGGVGWGGRLGCWRPRGPAVPAPASGSACVKNNLEGLFRERAGGGRGKTEDFEITDLGASLHWCVRVSTGVCARTGGFPPALSACLPTCAGIMKKLLREVCADFCHWLQLLFPTLIYLQRCGTASRPEVSWWRETSVRPWPGPLEGHGQSSLPCPPSGPSGKCFRTAPSWRCCAVPGAA